MNLVDNLLISNILVWAYVKASLRKSCTNNFLDMRDNRLPTVMSSIPITFLKRVSRHCFRYMSGYRFGLTGPLLDYSVKKYKGHRCVNQTIINTIEKDYRDHKESIKLK